jgi:hypothetical protein
MYRDRLLHRATQIVFDSVQRSGQVTDPAEAYEYARRLCTPKSDRCLQQICMNPPGLYWHTSTQQVVEVIDYLEEPLKGRCHWMLVNVAEHGTARADRTDILKLTEQQLLTATIGDRLAF